PWFAAFFVFFAMANCGLPGTSGFVGEFMVILSSFQQSPLVSFGAASTLVFSAAFSLWLMKRVVYGKVANEHVAALQDVNFREVIVLGVFAIGVLFVGIYPKPLTDLMAPAVSGLTTQMAVSKLP
ncbi:MAG: proton-conducting transporter membrane subunit, partial [Lysobacteraceae bacterium]